MNNYVKNTSMTSETYKLVQTDDPLIQEKILIEEVLNALLGYDGDIIKKSKDSHEDRFIYFVDDSLGFNNQLVRIVQKMLVLCEHHDRLVVFTNKYSNFEYGLIS